jgi:hypothetical protein
MTAAFVQKQARVKTHIGVWSSSIPVVRRATCEMLAARKRSSRHRTARATHRHLSSHGMGAAKVS